jgi:putative phage-type endonuclease
MEQRTPEWDEARRGKMTCSRMAEAVGLIGSRRRLWRELTGRERDKWASADGRVRMQDGVNYEPLAIAQYEQWLGSPIVTTGFLMHPHLDWIGGSPDALVESTSTHTRLPGGVEVKCPPTQYGRIPDYYMPQMQGLMEVTDRGWWDFVCWTPDVMVVSRVWRSFAYWEQLHTLLAEFWFYVEADIEPPVFARGTKPKITAAVTTRLLNRE